MENNISPLIAGQLPEHIQESTPLFKDFIVTYYQYASQRDKAIGKIQNNTLDIDIDETTDVCISNFYATYGEYLPKEVAIDQRNFIKFLNKIYEAKGTEKSLKLIFKLLFNDNVSVTYPTEQVLRASGGKWTQENYITVTPKYGKTPSEGESVWFSNKTGDYEIVVSRLLPISSTDTRIYFRTYNKIFLMDDQLVYGYGEDKTITFIGQLRKSPSKIIIKTAGAGWQKGQVVVIGGSISPTISRVTSINSVGGVTGIEILDHGFIHPENQLVSLSPYPNKPSNSGITITSELISTGVFHHSISIEDSTEGTSESLVGITNTQTDKSYFLESYVSELYVGATAISITSTQVSSLSTVNEMNDVGLTMDEWLTSRATFFYETDNVVKTRGYYEDDTGKISNQEVRIQDNYFYQAFSYVMETTKDISEYLHVLNITHPAGTKRFSKIIKENDYSFEVTTDRVISVDSVYANDVVEPIDSLLNKLTKEFADTVTVTETIAMTLNNG